MSSGTVLAFAGIALVTAFAGSLAALWGGDPAACTTELDQDAITQDDANALYDCIEGDLLAGYAEAADVPGVAGFREWPLVSTAPLVSATHGRMFVNHFVNPPGAELYTRWEEMDGARFPVGSIFVKESFRILKGEVKRGTLFLMEKVAEDAAPDGWVYTRVFPNGKYERTNGPKSGRMAFCHDCHAATLELQDAAFFPPEAYRTTGN
ncbi:MAG: cytochrome P460 family protein [Pseudomonadota bacterium]